MFRSFGRNLCTRAESGSQDVSLRMSFGFFSTDHPVLHQVAYIGMIVGQTRDVRSPHQIQAAIADVGVVKLAPQKGNRSSRSPHTVEFTSSSTKPRTALREATSNSNLRRSGYRSNPSRLVQRPCSRRGDTPISSKPGIIPNLGDLFVLRRRLLRHPDKAWSEMTFVTISG